MAGQKKSVKNGMVLFADGPGPYVIELLSPNANRGFRRHCPKTYYNNYHLDELKDVIAILETLFKQMNLDGPC